MKEWCDMGKSDVRKESEQLAKAAAAALTLMKNAGHEALRKGETAKGIGLLKEVAEWKLSAMEKARQAGVVPNRFGPLATPLFTRTGILPDDPDVKGAY